MKKTTIALTLAAALASGGLIFTAAAAPNPHVRFEFRSIDLSDVTATQAMGINPEGDIVGRYRIGSLSHSYILSGGAVITIDPPSDFGIPGTSQAWGINPQGDVVGLYADAGTVPGGDTFRTRAYLRDASGNFTRIDVPGAENTLAIKVSPAGQVVGCYHHQDKDFAVSGGGTMHGYVYHNGDYKSLDVPGTMHNGISDDGRIIVGVVWPTASEFHAYKVEDGTYSPLDLPSYVVLSDARDVNPSGEIVGFFIDSSNKNHGFLINNEGFTQIDFPGGDVVFTQALGINPEGNIVGRYMNKDAAGILHTHGFIATRLVER